MARLVFVPERDVSIFQDALCVGPLRRLQSTGFLIYIYICIYICDGNVLSGSEWPDVIHESGYVGYTVRTHLQ